MAVLRSFIPIPEPLLVLSNHQLRSLTQAGFRYQPEASGDITGNWTNYGTLINGNGLITNLNVSLANGQSFYRLRVTRAP